MPSSDFRGATKENGGRGAVAAAVTPHLMRFRFGWSCANPLNVLIKLTANLVLMLKGAKMKYGNNGKKKEPTRRWRVAA